MFCENDRPLHQGSSGEHFSTGVFKPCRIDSRILGIESKYRVSWMARQSSSETRTPLFFFPRIWTGSWDFSDSARSLERLARAADTVLIRSPLLFFYLQDSCFSEDCQRARLSRAKANQRRMTEPILNVREDRCPPSIHARGAVENPEKRI